MSRARTLLVAVNDIFLDGVVDWVAGDARIEVVGRSHSGADALTELDQPGLDLVLADVTLPDMSGFELVRRIKGRDEAPLVVLLSFHDSQAARLEAWAAGADGFLSKPETADRLLPLVGDLLRRRNVGVREVSPGHSPMRVLSREVSE